MSTDLTLRFSNVTAAPTSTNGTHAPAAAIALSSREVNVLNQVARGLSNKQIALKLGISDKTVRNHLSRIFRKLDAGNRTQAVMNAMRVGLLTV
ncbi:MAG: response regulator transcription factor [Chloroflexi bacterium]|nr:MAG: response regulator transcription factor [Chloroflexota bacterium]TMG28366.1 MAG: response regulator transcription factor [Chloroflexota bacterium]